MLCTHNETEDQRKHSHYTVVSGVITIRMSVRAAGYLDRSFWHAWSSLYGDGSRNDVVSRAIRFTVVSEVRHVNDDGMD